MYFGRNYSCPIRKTLRVAPMKPRRPPRRALPPPLLSRTRAISRQRSPTRSKSKLPEFLIFTEARQVAGPFYWLIVYADQRRAAAGCSLREAHEGTFRMTAIGALEDPPSVLRALGLNTCQHHYRSAFWARGPFGRDRSRGCESESEHQVLLMGRPEALGRRRRRVSPFEGDTPRRDARSCPAFFWFVVFEHL